MNVLEDNRRIGDDTTESVEPNSKVAVVFFAENIHGQLVAIASATPTISIEWIGKSLWWGGTAFNAPAPVFFDMIHSSGSEWGYVFKMIGYVRFDSSVPGPQFLCVEASIDHGELTHVKQRYCIPPLPSLPSDPGLARRRFPRRRLIPTPDKTGLSRDSCRR